VSRPIEDVVRVDRRPVLKTLLGFVIAIALVYLLGVVAGWEQILERLRMAQPAWVVLACLSTLLSLVAWGKTWQVVLKAVDVSVPYRRLFVTFLAGTFVNYVTPMGQAGGEPFVAYVLARDTGATYEQSLASVVVTDLLRLLPFFTAAGVGLGYLLTVAGLAGPIRPFALLLVVLAAALPLLVVGGWQLRTRIQSAILRALGPIARRTDRLSLASVRDRIDRLYATIEVIAGSPRVLVVALTYAYVGWVLFALPLYFAAISLGTPVSLLLVGFVVPVSVVVSFTPLPGGLGAIEGTLVALLAALAALSTVDAFAVTTVYRLASYWFVIGVGGLAILWVIRRN